VNRRASAQRAAVRTKTTNSNTLNYLLGDHLGSTSLTVSPTGVKVADMQYKAWGETRSSTGTTPTDYQYTGQRNESGIKLYYYNARWYDSALGRFAQADTIIPGGVQGYDRYAYINNDPINNTDPTGHIPSPGQNGCQLRDEDGNCLITDADNPATGPDSSIDDPAPTTNNELVDDLNGAAAFFQFLALLVDGPLGVVEVGAAGVVCGVTVEVGCLPGAGEVVLDFDLLYNATPLNLAETIFSGISAGLTIAADLIDDGEWGEPSNTAVTTFLVGLVIPDPALDAVVDFYGLGYATGEYNGIDTIINGGGILKR
jgi:RHS repeat-associated protein